MGPSANDFSNRRRPGRRGDGPGMGPGRGPTRRPGSGAARGPGAGPGGGPRDSSRGRTGRGLSDPRRPAASTFRRLAPRPDGPGGPGGGEGRRWTRDREDAPSGDTWRRGEGGGQRSLPPGEERDRPRWRMARRPEGPPARPFRPARGPATPSDSEPPGGEFHAAAAPSELIWGRHAALAALESERPIHRIWCTPEMRFRPTFLQLLRDAKASGVLVEEVTWARLGQISGGAVHQGIVLQPAAADTLDLPTLIDGCKQLGEAPLLVAVDGLTDPQNLGAILRSAEALGVHGLVLPQRRNAGLTGSVAKVAAGALEHLPVARVVNLNRSLETLREEGYRVVGLDAQGSVSLEEADLDGPLVVITGSEGQGLSMLTRRNCDQLVRIPLRGSTPSLNASVATALVLYEVARRGWMRGLRGTAKPPRLKRPHLPTEAAASAPKEPLILAELPIPVKAPVTLEPPVTPEPPLTPEPPVTSEHPAALAPPASPESKITPESKATPETKATVETPGTLEPTEAFPVSAAPPEPTSSSEQSSAPSPGETLTETWRPKAEPETASEPSLPDVPGVATPATPPSPPPAAPMEWPEPTFASDIHL